MHDIRVENYAAIFANQLVVPTLITVGLVGTFGDLSRAIALLTLDVGTGIRISVPTTVLSALTYAARNGVFIRSGRAIEGLAKIDPVGFDKTGTLTQVLAILINNGSAILAELNGLRPLLGPGDFPSLQHSLDPTALLEEVTRWQENPVAPANPEPETLIS